MNALKDFWRNSPSACAALAIALLVAIRIAMVIATPLEIGPDDPAYLRLIGPNQWPDDALVPGFQAACNAYADAMLALHARRSAPSIAAWARARPKAAKIARTMKRAMGASGGSQGPPD